MEDVNLTRSLFSNTIWKFLERFLAQGIAFVVSLVIARFLTPEDYSVVALVTIFFTFANVLISGGFNTALIQKKDADSLDYSTVLFFSVAISLVVYGVLFFTAPLIASAYNEDNLVLIVRIMGLTLPITALKSIWCAYISSHLQFKKFFFATLVGTIISGVIGIVMALRGYGPWAIVAQQMINTIIDTIILIFSTRIHLPFKISFSKFKTLFNYGWKILVSSLIGTVYSETSPLVIGIRFSKDDLSYYTKGKSFPALISSSITSTLSAVFFPVLSKVQSDKEKILFYTRKFISIASFLVFPFLLGFFAIADNFVLVILTSKWMGSVFYIRLFCVVCMFDVIALGNCETIKAIGRSDVYLIIEIIKKVLYFATIILFVVFAKTPVILAISAVVCTIIQIVVNSIPNAKLINYKIKSQFYDILPNLIISSVMCVFVILIGLLIENPLISLITQVLMGVGIYLLLSLLTNNKNLKSMLNILKKEAKQNG